MNKQAIIDEIRHIEKQYEVEIVMAIESGSRAWGFPSTDSDYDVRFIYKHVKNHYLKVFDQKDTIDIPVDPILDINGWDLKKALQLIYKSNPPLHEWIQSPIMYIGDESFRQDLLGLAQEYFSEVGTMHHYINLAKKSWDSRNSDGTMRVKKLFYVLRPLFACKWIDEFHTIPPMNIEDLLSRVDTPQGMPDKIKELIDYKANLTESDCFMPDSELVLYIQSLFEYLEEKVKCVNNRRKMDSKQLDTFFVKCLN